MALITETGRIIFAETLYSMPFFLAWGRGNEEWDDNYNQPNGQETGLVSEIARRSASVVEYCTPAPDGEISVPSGRYTVSDTSTKYIHIKFDFTLEDSKTETIRECGVFVGTQIRDGVTTDYFLPEHILNPGRMIFIEHFQAISLVNDFRRTFDFVITI